MLNIILFETMAKIMCRQVVKIMCRLTAYPEFYIGLIVSTFMMLIYYKALETNE